MLTVTLTDAADGTGFAAAVAGSGGAAVNVFWRAYPEQGDAAWAGPAARTGDGTVTLATGPGLWWVYAAATGVGGGEASAPVSGLATADPLPVRTRVRKGVAAAIAALPFAYVRNVGTIGGRVVEMMAIDESLVDKPGIGVSSADEVSETVEPDTNATRMIGVPVLVAIVTTTSGPETMDALDSWRGLIVDRFNGPRPPGVPEAVRSVVEPLVVGRTGDPKLESVRSALVVRVYCRVPQPQGY